MANHLILRVLIMACIFVGGLFAIIATAGKEWQKYEDIEYRYGRTTYYAGLWEYCFKEEYYDESNTRCSPVDEILRMMKSSIKEKLYTTRAFMIIGILLYGAAFLLLALAHFLKKNLLQKIVAPILWSILSCGIIAMSCIMSLFKELHDYNKARGLFPRGPYTYSWSFGIAWAAVAVALVGAIISTVGLFMSPRETDVPIANAPTMNFKK